MQFTPRHRWTWRRGLTAAAVLGLGALLCAGPYVAVIGALTVKPSARRMFTEMEAPPPQPPVTPPGADLDDPCSLTACALSMWGVWWVDQNASEPPPLAWAIKAVLIETIHAYQYVAWLPAVVGLWWFRLRLRQRPGMAVLLLLSGLIALLLGRLAWSVGYLSERHTLIIVLCGSFWAAAMLVRWAEQLPDWLPQPVQPRTRLLLGLAWLLLWTGWCLPRTLKPLHANRAGFRKAGEWLAQHVQPGDTIIDPFCWAHFYAGGVLGEIQPVRQTAEHKPMRYVVLTHSSNAHNRFELTLDPAREHAKHGKLVFRWTPNATQRRKYRAEEVQVYAVPQSVTWQVPIPGGSPCRKTSRTHP